MRHSTESIATRSAPGTSPTSVSVDHASAGRGFYAVTTSTDWAPFFPIFRSTRLGRLGARRPRLRASARTGARATFGRPTSPRRTGVSTSTTPRAARTARCASAVATADRPEGPYIDHGPLIGQRLRLDRRDGAPTTSDGSRWLLWKEDGNAHNRPTPIWAQRLSDDGLVLLGEKVELLRNDAPWEGRLVEAPHVIRRDGWFYMFYSGNTCCGEDCAYAVGVARARSLAGPWEKCPRNPILASNDAFRCPGHGAPVDDGNGNWYYLYHAYEARADAIYVGRQLCLDAIRWNADGWPSINGGQGPSRIADAPFPLERQRSAAATAGRPTSARRSTAAGNGRSPVAPRMELDRGALVLTAEHPRRGTDPLAAVAARARHDRRLRGDGASSMRAPRRAGTLASLCAYGSHRDALGIGVRDGIVVRLAPARRPVRRPCARPSRPSEQGPPALHRAGRAGTTASRSAATAAAGRRWAAASTARGSRPGTPACGSRSRPAGRAAHRRASRRSSSPRRPLR